MASVILVVKRTFVVVKEFSFLVGLVLIGYFMLKNGGKNVMLDSWDWFVERSYRRDTADQLDDHYRQIMSKVQDASTRIQDILF